MNLPFFLFRKKGLSLLVILFLCLIAFLIFQSYDNVNQTYNATKIVIADQNIKRSLLNNMYNAARKRSIILITMSGEKDPFDMDELNLEFSAQASKFIAARQAILTMQLDEIEKRLLKTQNKLTKINAPIQNVVAQLFVDEQHEKGQMVLFGLAIPGQNQVLLSIDTLIAEYDKKTADTLLQIDKDNKKANQQFLAIGILLLLASIIFIVFFMNRISQEDQKKLQDASNKLNYQAHHDPLTKLLNRRAFEQQLKNSLTKQKAGITDYLLYLDLDQFKIVNDTCGHLAGDELLFQLPPQLQKHLKNTDIFARLGGDEFGIILKNTSQEQSLNIAKQLINTTNEFQFIWQKRTFHIGVSIGIVLIDGIHLQQDELLKHADSSCYAAKDAGRNQFHLYQIDDITLQQREQEMDWVTHITHALKNNQFILYLQPIVSTKGQPKEINYECLLRLIHPNGKIIPPGAFLPAAERYNKMKEIDRWVIKETLSMLNLHPKLIANMGYCSLNISSHSLTDKDFLAFVIKQILPFPALLDKICIEITETSAISNQVQAHTFITTLKKIGIRFSLDDFGSGYSSFNYLKNLPIDLIKIDGLLIKDIVNDPIDLAIVQSIHQLALAMGKKTVAEYVENNEILEALETIGVHYVQGYAIDKPKPIGELKNLMDIT